MGLLTPWVTSSCYKDQITHMIRVYTHGNHETGIVQGYVLLLWQLMSDLRYSLDDGNNYGPSPLVGEGP